MRRDFIERTASYLENHIPQEYCALSPVLGDRLRLAEWVILVPPWSRFPSVLHLSCNIIWIVILRVKALFFLFLNEITNNGLTGWNMLHREEKLLLLCPLPTKKLSLAIWFQRNEVTSHCSHRPSTHPERSSGWRWGIRHSVLWEKLAEEAFR